MVANVTWVQLCSQNCVWMLQIEGLTIGIFFAELDPAAPIGFTKRSAVYLQQRKYVEALADLDRAIAVDSTFLQGYLNRGRLLRQMCRYAIGDFNVNPLRTIVYFGT